MAGRQCSILSRVALFIAFAGIFSYVNFDRIRTWSAVNPEMSAYYRTIGAGYPLYAYHGDLSDLSRPGGADRTKLVPYFRDMQNDGGILITMSCLRIVFDRLGVLKNLQLNEYQLPFFAFLAMLAFSATLMLVRLPLFVSVLAYVPLLFVTVDFSDTLFADPRIVEAFGLTIIGVYALVVVWSRYDKGATAFAVTTTVFISWLNLSRQGILAQKLVLDALLIGYFMARAFVRGFRKGCPQKKAAGLELKKALALAASFPIAAAYTVAISAFLSLYYQLPYSSAYIPTHGSGPTLYVSLGYAPNPFNVAWDDDVFQVNYMTFSDRPFKLTYPEWLDVTDPALRHEYARAVAEDPIVFGRNILQKAQLVHRYLTDDSIPTIFPYDLIFRVRVHQRRVYLAVLIILALLTATAMIPKWRWLWIAIWPMVAVLIVSLVPPLVVSPGYLLGFIGALYSLFFAWVGVCGCAIAFRNCRPVMPCHLDDRFSNITWAAVVGIIIAAGLYAGCRELINARQDARLINENPYDVMSEKGYRLAENFNRLALADQKRALRRLVTTRPRGTQVDVFCRHDLEMYWQLGPQAPDLQTSICAFVLEEDWRRNFRVAMVVNYFSDKWREVLPRSDQGPVGSNVTLGSVEPCPEAPRRTTKFWWDRPQHHLLKCVYSRFANPNWRGKFYMNLLPVGQHFTEGTDVLVASVQEIVGSPEKSQFSFVERNVGMTRLQRYDGALRRRFGAEDARLGGR